MRFGMLRGPQILRAPENDQGSEPDDEFEEDLSLDEDDEADDEDDQTDDESDEDLDDADDEGEEPPERPTRGQGRVAKATRENADLKRTNADLERRLADLERARSAPPAPVETPEQRTARFAAMEPWERTEALRQEDAQRTASTLQRIEFESRDNADRLAFETLASRNKTAAKLKDEVEKRLKDMRSNNMTAPRETILKYLIGERMLANGARAEGKARKSAAANRDQQRARPSSGRADAPADDRRTSNAKTSRNKRVESYQL